MSPTERFWRFVRKTDTCWLWTGAVFRPRSGGYGRFRWNGRTGVASRFAYETFIGLIPPGLLVCHRCDEPRCVRPDHLFLGTAQDNNEDALVKGRRDRYIFRRTRRVCGAANGRAKLTVEQVRRMRKEYAMGGVSYATLAERYGLATYAVQSIIRRFTWQSV